MPTTALPHMAVMATQMAHAHQARLDSAVLGGLNGLGAPAWAGLAPGASRRPQPPQLATSERLCCRVILGIQEGGTGVRRAGTGSSR